MSEFFEYSSTPSLNVMNVPGPLWPDFNSSSEIAKKMINAKKVNDMSFWPEMCEVFAHDVKTLPLERFKVWASVMTVPFMSNSKHSQYIRIALNAISRDPDYAQALQEPFIGLTEQDYQQFYQMFSDYPTTMNRIQHLAHLEIAGFGKDFLREQFKIVELGGGIGDMADIVNKLGFKGEYFLYDLPEVGNIQKWYHEQLGHTNIVHTSNFDDLSDADLVIATWSLTEMPMRLRDDVLEKISKSKNWLIAYSTDIFGLDNEAWITEKFIPAFKDTHRIEFIDIPFMAWDGGTKYLIIKENLTSLSE